jgi:predicted O-methyltransferase YrrM
MDRLSELALKYGTDKVYRERTDGMANDSAHDYTPLYHELLKDRDIKKMLEIGIGEKKYSAPSLRMWAEYFPEAEVYGCDIDEGTFIADNPRVHCFRCDQSNRTSLRTVEAITGGNFDFIIDDGSHRIDHQRMTFEELFPLVKSGGIYVIEDVDHFHIVAQSIKVPFQVIGPHAPGRLMDHRIIIKKD